MSPPTRRRAALYMCVPAAWLLIVPRVWAHAGEDTVHLSISRTGGANNGDTYIGRDGISQNGRLAVFHSSATTLVAGDTGTTSDIFMRDRITSATTRVAAGNGNSYSAAISAGANAITFTSLASDLVAGDTNSAADVFVYDLRDRSVQRISVSSAGAQGNGASSDGSLSADGRFVAFQSLASNLVADDVNGTGDVFVHDRVLRTTELVSRASDGSPGNANSAGPPAISDDGGRVAFASYASNLVAGDTNGFRDVFVRDRGGTTQRVSIGAGGQQPDASSLAGADISGDGRVVAFHSYATNLVPETVTASGNVFARDTGAGTTVLVSRSTQGVPGDSASYDPSISRDGRRIAFGSTSSNLVPNPSPWRQVYLRDLGTGVTSRMSELASGVPADYVSDTPAISSDGEWVTFSSRAGNLAPSDESTYWDAYVHGRDTQAPAVTFASPPSPAQGEFRPQRSVTFEFDSSEPASTLACRLDGGGYAPCTSPVTFAGLSDGPHTFDVTATDLWGNVGLGSRSWSIDTSPPQTVLIEPRRGLYVNGQRMGPEPPTGLTVLVGADAIDVVVRASDTQSGLRSVCYAEDDGPDRCLTDTGDGTYAGTYEPEGPGSHRVTVTAVNGAGLEGSVRFDVVALVPPS